MGDYVFWLDADDVVDRIEVEKLRAVLQQLRAGDRAAYVVVRVRPEPGWDRR